MIVICINLEDVKRQYFLGCGAGDVTDLVELPW